MTHWFMLLITPYRMPDITGGFGPLECNIKTHFKDLAAAF